MWRMKSIENVYAQNEEEEKQKKTNAKYLVIITSLVYVVPLVYRSQRFVDTKSDYYGNYVFRRDIGAYMAQHSSMHCYHKCFVINSISTICANINSDLLKIQWRIIIIIIIINTTIKFVRSHFFN